MTFIERQSPGRSSSLPSRPILHCLLVLPSVRHMPNLLLARHLPPICQSGHPPEVLNRSISMWLSLDLSLPFRPPPSALLPQ